MSCGCEENNYDTCSGCNQSIPDCDCSPCYSLPIPDDFTCEDGEPCPEVYPAECVEYTGDDIECSEEVSELFPDVIHHVVKDDGTKESRRLPAILSNINEQFCYIFSTDFIKRQLEIIRDTTELKTLFCEIACSCDCEGCTEVSGIEVSLDCPDIYVYWTAVSGAVGYEVQYKETTESSWTSVIVTSNNATITLDYDVTYDLRVRTVCLTGTSEWVVYDGGVTLSCDCDCDPVTDLGTTNTSTGTTTFSALIDWTSSGSTFALTYQPDGGSATSVQVTGATQHTLTGLTKGTEYTVTVTRICDSDPLCRSTTELIQFTEELCECPATESSVTYNGSPHGTTLNIEVTDPTGVFDTLGVVIWRYDSPGTYTFVDKLSDTPVSGTVEFEVISHEDGTDIEDGKTYVYTIFGETDDDSCTMGYSDPDVPPYSDSPPTEPDCGLYYIYTIECECPLAMEIDTDDPSTAIATYTPAVGAPFDSNIKYTFTTFRMVGHTLVNTQGPKVYNGTAPQSLDPFTLPAVATYIMFIHTALYDGNGDLVCEQGWNGSTFPSNWEDYCNVQFNNL